MRNVMEVIKKFFRKPIRIRLVLAGVVLVISGLGIIQVLGSDTGSEDKPDITTSTITTGDIRLSAHGSGNLIAAQEIQVGFAYGGVVEEILVEIGDTVQVGEVLAVLYDEELQDDLTRAEANYLELTSDAAIATAALDLAEAQKDVLTAHSTLSFYLSPYVYKAEIRLRYAQDELVNAINEAAENSSEEAEQRVVEAQAVVNHAELSLALNWETYNEKYVPDFYNFRWRDEFGFWHDYYAPPSEIEVAEVWAELAAAEARVDEAELYLAALVEGSIPEEAYGSKITNLEIAAENLTDAAEKLEEARLTTSMEGVVMEIKLTEEETIGTDKVFTIARLNPPTLEAAFDEGDWSMVMEGSPVEVIFDALPERIYQGEIFFVDPTLQKSQNTTVVSALVELDLNETGWAGLPLLSASSIEVIAGEVNDAVLLPIDGLQESSVDQGIVLVENDGEFISREVELGLWDVLYVEVLDGLSAGDVVLIGDLK